MGKHENTNWGHTEIHLRQIRNEHAQWRSSEALGNLQSEGGLMEVMDVYDMLNKRRKEFLDGDKGGGMKEQDWPEQG